MKLSLLNHASKRVVVVGGGSAGISTAARLSKSSDIDVTLVDGSKKHYYQPIWTLVGGGLYNFSDSEFGFQNDAIFDQFFNLNGSKYFPACSREIPTQKCFIIILKTHLSVR